MKGVAPGPTEFFNSTSGYPKFLPVASLLLFFAVTVNKMLWPILPFDLCLKPLGWRPGRVGEAQQ